MPANPKRPKPIRNEAYLRAVCEMPCILTEKTPTEAAHIRYGFFSKDMKPGDDLVFPLSPDLHRRQHTMGEISFWYSHAPEWLVMDALKALARERYRTWLESNS